MIISNIYKRAFNVLSKMPFKLWGLSLLSSLLTILVLVFGVLPIVIVPVIAVLSAGMAAVYLDGFNGKEVYSDQLFKGFKDFWRTAGGMCWKKLWIFIWFLVPIAGPFIAISKYYAYSFTPYILNEEKSVNATRQAVRSTASNQPSGLLLSPRFPPARNVYQESTACRSTVCTASVGRYRTRTANQNLWRKPWAILR